MSKKREKKRGALKGHTRFQVGREKTRRRAHEARVFLGGEENKQTRDLFALWLFYKKKLKKHVPAGYRTGDLLIRSQAHYRCAMVPMARET